VGHNVLGGVMCVLADGKTAKKSTRVHALGVKAGWANFAQNRASGLARLPKRAFPAGRGTKFAFGGGAVGYFLCWGEAMIFARGDTARGISVGCLTKLRFYLPALGRGAASKVSWKKAIREHGSN